MRINRAFMIAGLAGLLAACTSSGGSDDTTADTGVKDSGVKDSAVDGAAVDGAVIDGAMPIDAAMPDARVIDARVNDASVVDASLVDAQDGGGGMLSGSVMVVRVGDGVAAPTNASALIVVEERSLVDGSLIRMIPLPTAVVGTNHPLTVAGTSAFDGQLSRSVDGHFLVVPGYNAAPGVATIATTASATTARVVGRINAAGVVDTSTLVNAFSGSNIRGAVTIDGAHFWLSGSASAATGGVQYVDFGSTGTAVQVAATPNNTRGIAIIANNLYVTSASGTTFGVLQVGSGLPTVTGTATTLLPGFPTATASSSSMVGVDTDAVGGIDVLYVADDRSIATGGGIQKWTFNGTQWNLTTTFNSGLTGGARGLTAVINGSTVGLVFSTAESPARLAYYIDNGGAAAPALNVVQTAANNTFYRGVALPPN